MQMQIFRKVGLGLMALGLTLSALAILSCGGGDDGDTGSDGGDTTERTASLSGAGERPTPVPNTPGSGTAVLTVSDDQTQITYELTYTALTGVTQAHIHVGDPNTAGPIILFLCTNTGTGTNVAVGGGPLPTPPPCPTGAGTVTGTLTAANLSPKAATAATPAVSTFADAVTQLVNGNTYTNVHTVVNTGGEIRGQDL